MAWSLGRLEDRGRVVEKDSRHVGFNFGIVC